MDRPDKETDKFKRLRAKVETTEGQHRQRRRHAQGVREGGDEGGEGERERD